MFFFSKGKLLEILEKSSLFSQDSLSFKNVSIRTIDPKPIFKIIDIITIESGIDETMVDDIPQNILPLYLLILYDGINYVPCIVDSSKEHYLFNFENFLKNTEFKNDENKFLRIGTVIILNRYSFIYFDDLIDSKSNINSIRNNQNLVNKEFFIDPSKSSKISSLASSSKNSSFFSSSFQSNFRKENNDDVKKLKTKLKNAKQFAIDDYNYNFILKLVEFSLIGFESVDEVLSQSDKKNFDVDAISKHPEDLSIQHHVELNVNNENPKNKKQYLEITHTIDRLNVQLSNSFWSIRVFVAERTPCKDFLNRKNGQTGRIMRLKLLSSNPDDLNHSNSTCFKIEAVLFNSVCESEQIKSIKLRSYYFISNGTIKNAKGTCLAWPNCIVDKCNSTINSLFDIYFTKETILFELNEENIANCVDKNENSNENTCHQAYLVESNKNSQLSNIKVINTVNTTQENKYNVHQNQLSRLNTKFTPLCKLNSIKPKTLVDIMGIIEHVDQVKLFTRKPYNKSMPSTATSFANSKPLSIRNIKIIDQTNVIVSVAFWGKQAEEFSLRPGSCIFLNDAEVSNYMGRSLSVIRKTGFLDMPADLPAVLELKNWYVNEKLKKTNSILN